MKLKRAVLITAAIALASLVLSTTPVRACSRLSGQGFRRLDHVALLGTATSLALPAARGVPADIAEASEANSPAARARRAAANGSWWDRFRVWLREVGPQPRTALPVGQVVRLTRVAGPDSARIAAALPRSRGEVVLVRWLGAPNCGPRLDESGATFLPPGETVFALGRLRPASGWVGDRPTFDLLSGSGVRPLAWPDSLGPRPPERPRMLLAPVDYFELYRHLPREDSIPLDTAEALRPLRRWLAAHPALQAYEEAKWEEHAVKFAVYFAVQAAGRRRR